MPDARERAGQLAVTLKHRGPDAQDTRLWDDACLVHDRLSIIDLSEAGNEPMPNEDGSIWVVFNGEIYNHLNLRRELEASGHTFRSRTDTEVIPHLYEEHGPDFVQVLRGMFACALLDLNNHRLVLARDRFGIKPLFYGRLTGGTPGLAFASEIRALRRIPEIDDRPNIQALGDFLALSFVPPPATFFEGIACLEPGHLLEASWDSSSVRAATRCYHRWSISPNPQLTLETATQKAGELLEAAVGSQIQSDVPLGALLSGGIDSSLVSACAQDALGGKLSTFNVRFPGLEYDETPAAEAVSRHIASHHNVVSMDDMESGWDYVCSVLGQPGQPFGDTSIFGVHAVSKRMRRHITVALSGDGGDEGFGGYPTYSQIEQALRFERLPGLGQRAVAAGASLAGKVGLLAPGTADAGSQLIGASDAEILAYILSWIRPKEHAATVRGLDVLPVSRLFERQWDHDIFVGSSRLERLSALATETRARLILAGDYLPKVDAASMKEGLEVRVPMLDEDFFAFGLTLPHSLKSARGASKPVLRAVAAGKIPPEVAALPKHGFNVPVDRLLDGAFKMRLKDELLGPGSGLNGLLETAAYRPIVNAFCEDRPLPRISRAGLYQRAMMLLSIHLAVTDQGFRSNSVSAAIPPRMAASA
jgi:asparagine synthase (glutamine-hydrolysing)